MTITRNMHGVSTSHTHERSPRASRGVLGLCFALVPAVLSTAGCARTLERHEASVRALATSDLSCEGPQIQVTSVPDSPNYLAEGCGKKARYVWVEGSGWVLNSPVESTHTPSS
jgi:hypothetical protein